MTTISGNKLGEYTLKRLERTVANTNYYIGHRIGDENEVVVKTSPLRPGSEEFGRMALELRVLAPMVSNFVAPLLDAGHDSSVLYAVFPHYAGGPTSPNLSATTNISLLADAARGAHDLFQAGIVHRNIRPSTILRAGRNGVLSDLGMLRSLGQPQATTTVGPIGSPQFSDPDLLSGKHLGTHHSDIWSLGATLHYLLCGKHLAGELPKGGVQQVLRARLQAKVVIDSQLPTEIASIVQCCIKKGGYSTSQEFADDLDRINKSNV